VNSFLEHVTAVVLAGGLGTRIKSLYPDLPKPMIPVNGKPFVEWVLRYLFKQGVRRAIISSGYRAEVIEKYAAGQPVAGMQVDCVAEPEPLGTAGGFLHAASSVPKSPAGWLVLNGDSLLLADLGVPAQIMNEPTVQAVVTGIEVPDTSRYGKLRFDSNGQLLQFAEKEPGKGVVNAGVYFFKNTALLMFPAQRCLSFEKDVFPALLRKEACIKVYLASGAFLDIGTPESLAQADSFIRQNLTHFQT
jgi:D-glycero-alpha-D-manno-heptose 1-phosphate guanylyltransferase